MSKQRNQESEIEGDLIVLTACRHSCFAIRGLLSRAESLQIKTVKAHFIEHPNKDPGCRLTADTLLRAQIKRFSYALVAFDRFGSGRDSDDPGDIASDVRSHLERNGWQGRAEAIVFDPELESWIWSRSPRVDKVLGWHARIPSLREWLVDQGLLSHVDGKPARPKEAVDRALAEVKQQKSAWLFEELAKKVTLRDCQDASFIKLCETLRAWFPAA